MIFVDTAFWIALRNDRDAHHGEASTLLRAHGQEPLITSNHVRGETWSVLLRRAGHGSAVGFIDQLRASARVDVVHVPAEIEDEALRWLRRHDEREYSFVDATSFALMRTLRIRRVLTFDQDFAEAGFRVLRTG